MIPARMLPPTVFRKSPKLAPSHRTYPANSNPNALANGMPRPGKGRNTRQAKGQAASPSSSKINQKRMKANMPLW